MCPLVKNKICHHLNETIKLPPPPTRIIPIPEQQYNRGDDARITNQSLISVIFFNVSSILLRIRHSRASGNPVLAHSNDPAQLMTAYKDGHCNGYILKPVDRDELIARLKKYHII